MATCRQVCKCNINVFIHDVVDVGSAVGESDCEWTDCKILRKFYEDKVLWANIELRYIFGQKHINLSVCSLHTESLLFCFTHTFFNILKYAGHSLMKRGHECKTKNVIRCCDSKQNSFPAPFGRRVSSLVFLQNPTFYVVGS